MLLCLMFKTNGIFSKMKPTKSLKESLIKEKKRNFAERLWFIKYWANYIQTHNDEDWSKGQAILINSQLKSSKDFYSSLKAKKGLN